MTPNMVRKIPGMSRSDRERFFAKVKKTKTCWLWRGAIVNGYGSFGIRAQTYLAHRVSFYIEHGIDAAQCNHICDTPLCVNPQHLYSGTQKENVQDMLSRNKTWKARVSTAVGKWHGKLDEICVRAIRDAYSTGEHSYRDLATRFNVSAPTIHAIVKRRTWKHVT